MEAYLGASRQAHSLRTRPPLSLPLPSSEELLRRVVDASPHDFRQADARTKESDNSRSLVPRRVRSRRSWAFPRRAASVPFQTICPKRRASPHEATRCTKTVPLAERCSATVGEMQPDCEATVSDPDLVIPARPNLSEEQVEKPAKNRQGRSPNKTCAPCLPDRTRRASSLGAASASIASTSVCVTPTLGVSSQPSTGALGHLVFLCTLPRSASAISARMLRRSWMLGTIRQ